MGAWAYPFLVACGLLCVAGVAKLADPTMTVGALDRLGVHVAPSTMRFGGGAEALLGATAAVTALSWIAALVAVSYGMFGVFVVVAMVRGAPIGSCGCFGRADTPPSVVHLLVDVVAIVAAVGVVRGEGGGLAAELDGRALAGVPFLALVGVGVVVAYLVMTRLARYLVNASGR
ncbi:MAG: hypothetical protein FJW88_07810 [Actinobacteria bacterium]|nr:hypothetical protein [Actinomycetota bacterium]